MTQADKQIAAPGVLQSIQNRITVTLFASQSLYGTSTTASFILLPIIAAQLSGSDSAAGIPSTLTLLGRAAIGYPLGWLMDRGGHGRGLCAKWHDDRERDRIGSVTRSAAADAVGHAENRDSAGRRGGKLITVGEYSCAWTRASAKMRNGDVARIRMRCERDVNSMKVSITDLLIGDLYKQRFSPVFRN